MTTIGVLGERPRVRGPARRQRAERRADAPAAGLNWLVWLLWHTARTEDVAVNLIVAGAEQVRYNAAHIGEAVTIGSLAGLDLAT